MPCIPRAISLGTVRSGTPLAERFKRVATRLCLGARTRGSIVSLGPHAAHSLLLATSRAAAHEAAHGREDLTRQVPLCWLRAKCSDRHSMVKTCVFERDRPRPAGLFDIDVRARQGSHIPPKGPSSASGSRRMIRAGFPATTTPAGATFCLSKRGSSTMSFV